MRRRLALAVALVAMSSAANGANRRDLALADPNMAQCALEDGEARRFATTDGLPLIEIAIGDDLHRLAATAGDQFAASALRNGTLVDSRMKRLSVSIGGERRIVRTGGMSNVAVLIQGDMAENRIHRIDLYDQQCAVGLAVAMERAASLEATLKKAGFRRARGLSGARHYGDFTPIQYRNWKAAQESLAATPRRIGIVSSRWTKDSQTADVSVHNWGAEAPKTVLERDVTARLGPLSVFEADGTGRKYGIQFSLSDDALFQDGLKRFSVVETPGTGP